MIQREQMQYDVIIVGAGPAGLAAAIRLKQLSADINVCVLEKAAEIGAHTVSGAVIDPIVLNELIPDWQMKSSPVTNKVTQDQFLWLGEKSSIKLPHFLLPPIMHNKDNYIVSLGLVCRWLAKQAEDLGVDLFPGFNAYEILYNPDGSVKGVVTGDMGIARDGQQKAVFSAGIELHARYTLIAEGTRGSITKSLEEKFQLRLNSNPQKYGLGFKEIWQIDPDQHKQGSVTHTLGWPLKNNTGGGGFIYHLENNQIAIGLVVHLDYANPWLSPFDEFQRFKTHPTIKPLLEKGKRLAYAARTINEGGIQSLPELVFPGGALIGCAAGFVNLPKIKGSHNAIKSGMLAADAIIEAMRNDSSSNLLSAYPEKLRHSWLWCDLYPVRNIKPALFRWGTFIGSLYAGVELWLQHFRIKSPWTLQHKKADHDCLLPANQSEKIIYPAADKKITFDRLSSIYLSKIQHDEDQPLHLQLKNPDIPIQHNLAIYEAPEQRYCPATVYEIIQKDNQNLLQINAANCIHCKACDIKDPLQNINWVPPEGGSGPFYDNM